MDFKPFFLRFFEEFDYPEEARRDLLFAEEAMMACPESRAFLTSLFSAFPETPDWRVIEKYYEEYKQIQPLVKAPKHAVLLNLFIMMAEPLEKRYAREGVSRAIYHDSMMDLRAKLFECHEVFGEWGSFVTGWFVAFFSMERFALGRLQFETDIMCPVTDTDNGVPFEGGPCVNIHIPSLGPLKIEEVKESIQKAAVFYRDKRPGDKLLFRCESWLLFPPLQAALPASSGIKQFGQLFTPLRTRYGNGDLWRIFHTYDFSDLSKLETKTSLQRLVLQWLKEGKTIGEGLGVFTVNKP